MHSALALPNSASDQWILAHSKERERLDVNKVVNEVHFSKYRSGLESKKRLFQVFFGR